MLRIGSLYRHLGAIADGKLWRCIATESLQAQIPSAQNVKNELSIIERQLKRSSQIDGSKRIPLSTNIFSVPVPLHTIEPGLPSIDVHLRPTSGSTISKWLRRGHNHDPIKTWPHLICMSPALDQTNRVPGRITSLPDNKHLLIHMDAPDAAKMVREYGRETCQSQVLQLRVLDSTNSKKQIAIIRVKPQQVRCNAASLAIQNVDFLFCPHGRAVRVNVPIKLVNADASVGVKKGGWLKVSKRMVQYESYAESIPRWIEVDAKGLDLDHVVRVRDLPIPAGTRLVDQNFDVPVVKCTTEGGDEIRIH